MQKLFFFILLVLSLYSCRKPTKFNEVKVDENTTIQIPDYMLLSPNTNEKIVLKYSQAEKDFYLMIISESKEELSNFDMDYTIDGYFTHITSSPMAQNMKNGKVGKAHSAMVNGLNARSTEITGMVNNTGIYYRFMVIETNKKFYQLISWTRSDNKETLLEDMNKMLSSFKSIKH